MPSSTRPRAGTTTGRTHSRYESRLSVWQSPGLVGWFPWHIVALHQSRPVAGPWSPVPQGVSRCQPGLVIVRFRWPCTWRLWLWICTHTLARHGWLQKLLVFGFWSLVQVFSCCFGSGFRSWFALIARWSDRNGDNLREATFSGPKSISCGLVSARTPFRTGSGSGKSSELVIYHHQRSEVAYHFASGCCFCMGFCLGARDRPYCQLHAGLHSLPYCGCLRPHWELGAWLQGPFSVMSADLLLRV